MQVNIKKIPVFVSCPTDLNQDQQKVRDIVLSLLEELQLEARSLSRSDYPEEYPLKEVAIIAKHCAGEIVLGFNQFQTESGIWKSGTKKERKVANDQTEKSPSPWNHLEAWILFGLKLPLLIFREEGISGGVFDNGVTDLFVNKMPDAELSERDKTALKQVFLKWFSKVSQHYNVF